MKKSFILMMCVAVLSIPSELYAQNTKANDCPGDEHQEIQVIFMSLEPGPKSLSVTDMSILAKEFAIKKEDSA